MKETWALITGATNGIGLVAAEALVHQGMRVVVAGRNPLKTEQVARDIGAAGFLVADLSKLAEADRLANEYMHTFGQLDVLVNNAGAIFANRKESSEGIERTWALNHLAPFLLTTKLLPLLRQASGPHNMGARVVTVASMAHQLGRICFDDPEFKHDYDSWAAYAQSKLANILFTRELARREPELLCNCLHPGMVATGFAHNNGGWLSQIYRLVDLFALSPQEGAQTMLHLANSPEIKHNGAYYVKSQATLPRPQALDDGAAYRLWQLSQEYTQLSAP